MVQPQVSNVLPDLLPQTFMLSERSSLFNQLSSPDSMIHSESSGSNDSNTSFSVVEIREKDLTSKMTVQNINVDDDEQNTTTNVQHHILESCQAFVPEFVETVNIIDVSSDTDTGSTPNLDDRKKMSDDTIDQSDESADELEYELERELESINKLNPYSSISEVDIRKTKVITVEKQRISFDERGSHPQGSKDRDILKDSEENINEKSEKESHTEKKTPIWERDSFYNTDHENYDEPLAFSEDEDIPRYSMEMATDSDSDVVKSFFLFFVITTFKKFSFILFIVKFSINFFDTFFDH